MINFFNDIFLSALKSYRIFYILAFQDIKNRYKRSRLGLFWLTINQAFSITILALVFSFLLETKIKIFFPHLAIGLIVWAYIETTLIELSNSFIESAGMILETNVPLIVHPIRVILRNFIIFVHNFLLIVPLTVLIFDVSVSYNIFLLPLSILVLTLLIFSIGLIFAIVNLRFRDVNNILLNFLKLSFYLTPIIWTKDIIAGRAPDWFFYLNPFYYFIEIIRSPLLGGESITYMIFISILFVFVFGFFSILILSKYIKRISYWV